MFKITGKQKFGAVWAGGQCLAVFQKGEARTSDPAKAETLRALGYTVEDEAELSAAPETAETPENKPAETPEDKPAETAEPAKTSKKKGG